MEASLTSVVIENGEIDNEQRGEGRDRGKERERENFSFLGFQVFITLIYTLRDFSKQNFVFAYFKSCFRYLINLALKIDFLTTI